MKYYVYSSTSGLKGIIDKNIMDFRGDILKW